MTRTTLAPMFLTLAAMLALAGCGGGGLTANGQAVVTDSSGTASGFHFPAGVRLDGGAGTTTGMCTISRGSGSGVYGIVVDLYGDAQGEGHAVRSMEVMVQSLHPEQGSISVDLGGTDYAGSCHIDVTSVDEGRGNVTLSSAACPVTAGTDTARVDLQLDLSGCTVI